MLNNSRTLLVFQIFLKFKKDSGRNDLRLFFMARNYHLAYRFALAISYYNELLEKHPQSEFAQDAVFFRGMLYFDMSNFEKAAELFKGIADKGTSKWHNPALFYLGLSYEHMDKSDDAFLAYGNCDIYKLPVETLEKMRTRRP